MGIARPLHERALLRGRVRLFASPAWSEDGVPDMPWHSSDDLAAALGLSPDEAGAMLRGLRRDWARDVRTVATPEGLTTIAPSFMAEGLFAAMRWRWRRLPAADRRRMRAQYHAGLTAALKAMLPHASDLGRLAFALEAFDRDAA